jgi:hypothetical protein
MHRYISVYFNIIEDGVGNVIPGGFSEGQADTIFSRTADGKFVAMNGEKFELINANGASYLFPSSRKVGRSVYKLSQLATGGKKRSRTSRKNRKSRKTRKSRKSRK